jgi:hypothetical protein
MASKYTHVYGLLIGKPALDVRRGVSRWKVELVKAGTFVIGDYHGGIEDARGKPDGRPTDCRVEGRNA